MSTKKELTEELQELFYRSEAHLKEAQGYLEAAYLCTKDLQRHEDSLQVRGLLVQVEKAMLQEGRQMNINLNVLKTLIKDALGIQMIGIKDNEGESED